MTQVNHEMQLVASRRGRIPARRSRRRSGGGLIACLLELLLTSLFVPTGPVLAETSTSPRLELPRSHLSAPYDSPVYLTGHLAAAATESYDIGQWGVGATLLLRPGSASRFLQFLYDADLSMVLQADYLRLAAKRRILSADLILRHYFADMSNADVRVGAFLGAGLGASQITIPPDDGGGRLSYFSWVLEAGQEWKVAEHYLVAVKLQYRSFRHEGWDYSAWSLQGSVGLPFPW